MPPRRPGSEPTPVMAYIEAAPEPARTRLRRLAGIVREEAPGAVERIAYGLATWHEGENLLHLGAFARHVGIYPGPAAIVAFADDLTGYKTSKGAIQVPHDAPLPVDLVRRMTRWRVEQATAKKTSAQKTTAARKRRTTSRSSAVGAVPLASDVAAYNAAQSEAGRATCAVLADVISMGLSGSESKVWHGHPVWFLAGNPVVGYSTHNGSTRLLFWSGQSFDEAGLEPVGKFKAAQARYATVEEIEPKALRRWLEKARAVQWDYKNVAKNKGVLERLA